MIKKTIDFFKKINQKLFPQQLPGPAQDDDSPIFDPQHVVSPCPGILFVFTPDIEECAEISFFKFMLLHDEHIALSSDDESNISKVFPQSKHEYSKRGILIILL